MSATAKKDTSNEQVMDFSADVARLLDIVANALYTDHDVFLRELISNSADACDRLRYDAIAKPNLIKDNPDFRIHIFKDTGSRTLTVTDNGIGMNEQELIDNLGTIAKSGTAAMMESLKQSKDQKSLNLIGQFGVGFYAGYMVASKIEVISRKAGDKQSYHWESDGRSGFSVRPATNEETQKLDGDRGTAIILHIKDEGVDFLIDEKIKSTIQRYSDHIDCPIFMNPPEETSEDASPINQASAIWARPKSEVKDEQYLKFYKHICMSFDEPLITAHWQAEGTIEFSALLYIPTLRPWDLYDPSRKHAVKLYVRRVFITDDLEGLMYPWMRFLRGVIDSADLPLNISRESLQFNPIIRKIRSSVTRRVLGDLDKLSRNDAPAFETFWGQFGAVLKEGLYDAPEHRDELFKICRFYSTHDNGEKPVSLSDYVDRMKEGQDKIYYITGENKDALLSSPQIEGFKARGLEVLFLTDTIDSFWLQQIEEFGEKKFASVTKTSTDLDQFKTDKNKDDDINASKPDYKSLTPLIAAMAEALKDDVKEVKLSSRLTDTPACFVSSDDGIDMHMERVLKTQQQYVADNKRILEINPDHPVIRKMALKADDTALMKDLSAMLFDQATIIQGEPVKDYGAFVKRLSKLMESGL